MTEEDIKKFVAERDEVLLSGDLERVLAFHKKHNPSLIAVAQPDNMVLEASMHKARTAAKSLPIEVRKVSKAWLLEHGFTSLDDGDL